jgi:hypothetical protein
MFQHVFLPLLVFLLLLSLTWLGSLCWPDPGPAPSRATAKVRGTLHRLLKPRTPLDCPACCYASTAASGSEPVPVRPWCEVKSREELPNAETPTVSPVPTSNAHTPGSPRLRSTRWSEMASMAKPSASRPFALRPAEPRSVRDATPLCIV